jgi:hypothetical protein
VRERLQDAPRAFVERGDASADCVLWREADRAAPLRCVRQFEREERAAARLQPLGITPELFGGVLGKDGDKTGYAILYKRLSRGVFRLPAAVGGAKSRHARFVHSFVGGEEARKNAVHVARGAGGGKRQTRAMQRTAYCVDGKHARAVVVADQLAILP